MITYRLPFQGRWLGAAETERSLQICDNLSVSLRLPAPLQGEPLARCGGDNLSGSSGQLPLTRGADMLSSEVQHLKKKKDNTHSKV